LSDESLLDKVDKATDKLFESQEVPTRHIPAKPDSDYDLLVGELILRHEDKTSLLKDARDLLVLCTLLDKSGQCSLMVDKIDAKTDKP